MPTAQPEDLFTDTTPLKSGLASLVVREKRGRIGWLILLPTVILVLLSAGLATFLLLWLTVIHGDTTVGGATSATIADVFDSGAFMVDEGISLTKDGSVKGRLFGLTITTVTVRDERFSLYDLWLRWC